jgi:hypothetical protein
MDSFPVLMHTAIDAPDCRGLAEFYRELLGVHYRPGDEPPTDGSDDDADWLVLVDAHAQRVLTVQEKTDMKRATWPSEEVSMQMRMDFRYRLLRSSHDTASEPRLWVPRCSTTAPPMKVTACMCLPIPPDTPSACWSAHRRPEGAWPNVPLTP